MGGKVGLREEAWRGVEIIINSLFLRVRGQGKVEGRDEERGRNNY